MLAKWANSSQLNSIILHFRIVHLKENLCNYSETGIIIDLKKIFANIFYLNSDHQFQIVFRHILSFSPLLARQDCCATGLPAFHQSPPAIANTDQCWDAIINIKRLFNQQYVVAKLQPTSILSPLSFGKRHAQRLQVLWHDCHASKRNRVAAYRPVTRKRRTCSRNGRSEWIN